MRDAPSGTRGHPDPLPAPGGVPGGAVIGKTDAKAAEVVERPVSGPDFMATVLTLPRLDPSSDLHAGKRPVRMVAPGGEAIKEVVKG